MKRLNIVPRLFIGHALILISLLTFLLLQTPAVFAANWTVNSTTDSSDGSCNGHRITWGRWGCWVGKGDW